MAALGNAKEDCGSMYDEYLRTMNNMEDKTFIVNKLFKDMNDNRFSFIGSYLSFPIHNGRKLKKFYYDEDKKEYKTDGQLFEDTVNKLSQDLSKEIFSNKQYICFLLGAIISTDNVSHHLSFIYEKGGKLRVLDPGRRSWGPECAIVSKNVCLEAFKLLDIDISFIDTYTSKRGICGLCGICERELNPQDITLGTTLREIKTLFSESLSVNREAFCQSWSILLLLTDIERIKLGELEFNKPLMEYWDNSKADLEVCIRRFILWIIKTNIPTRIFTNKILINIERCFQEFNPLITTPKNEDVICDNNLRLDMISTRDRGRERSKSRRKS